MEHRASDTSEVAISVERKIPLTWVLGGLAAGALFFGSWAWNISINLNNVSRDVVQVTKDLQEIKSGQKEATTELTKGATRDATMENRVIDLERRFTVFEARTEAKSAVRP